TNKFIGYPIKDYIVDYKKRLPLIDTSNSVQRVRKYEFKSDYFSYDSAMINWTEKEFVERLLERMNEISAEYEESYLIRIDENMHSDSQKNNKLKLHDFRKSNNEEVILSGFQPDFILLLSSANYYIQIFIEPKGFQIHEEQWKEDLLVYLNEHQDDIIFDEKIEGLQVKGVRFYTSGDERGTINQISEIATGKKLGSLSFFEDEFN